jgi:CDP-diacylglycerol--glycerol-3-phosphate 3-phosphatidyltransferase
VLAVSLASFLLCTAVALLYAVRVLRRGRARHDRLPEGSPLVPSWVVEAFYWALEAPGRALSRRGVDPDAVTYMALACSLASLPLIASGRLAAGGVCVGIGGAFDALDGLVARARGRASEAGAVLDSVTDRLSDAAPLAGLCVVYRQSAATLLVPVAAIVASSLVSYARARADVHRLRLPDGMMRRHERVIFLLLGLLLAPIVPRAPLAPSVAYPLTLALVGFVAAAGFAGAFVLVARTRAALSPGRSEGRDHPARASAHTAP